MTGFADYIFEAFSQLQSDFGFLPARPFQGKAFASLIRKLTDEMFLYVFVYDGRPNNSNLSINMWIAPPHEPGDGLDNLHVGFKILIASRYDVDDGFFAASQDRIVSLIPYAGQLAPLVCKECLSPPFRTNRYIAYLMERAAFSTLLKNSQSQSVLAAFKHGANRKKNSYNNLATLADDVARFLLVEGDLSPQVVEYFGSDPKFLGRSLIGLLYVHTLTS